jgi:hypothetical protein
LSWLHAGAPAKPALYLSGFTRGNLQLWMGKLSQDAQSRWWLLQTRSNGTWTSEILPSTTRVKSFGNEQPDVIALTLINRFGNASPVAVVEKKPPGAASPGARNENGAKK